MITVGGPRWQRRAEERSVIRRTALPAGQKRHDKIASGSEHRHAGGSSATDRAGGGQQRRHLRHGDDVSDRHRIRQESRLYRQRIIIPHPGRRGIGIISNPDGSTEPIQQAAGAARCQAAQQVIAAHLVSVVDAKCGDASIQQRKRNRALRRRRQPAAHVDRRAHNPHRATP